MGKFRENLKAAISARPPEKLSKPAQFTRFWTMVLKVFWSTSGLQRSAALAFGTLFAIFPLVAVLLFLIPAFFPAEQVSQPIGPVQEPTIGESQSMQVAVRTLILSFLLPAEEPVREDLMNYFYSFQDQFTKETARIGIIGLIILFITAIALFVAVEKIFNDIWGIKQSRSFLKASTVFTGVIVWVPLFIGLSLYVTQELTRRGRLLEFLPILLVLFGLTLTYKFIPNIHVRLTSALWGGLFAAICWWAARALYGQSTKIFVNFVHLVEVVGAIPYYLSWLYIMWVIILMGVVISYCAQNFRALLIEDLSRRLELLDPVVLMGLLYIFADRFLQGKGELNFLQLRNYCPLSARELERHLSYLEGEEIIGQSASEQDTYYLKVPPEKLSPAQFINSFGKTREIFYYESPARDNFLNFLKKSDAQMEQFLSSYSLRDIVEGKA